MPLVVKSEPFRNTVKRKLARFSEIDKNEQTEESKKEEGGRIYMMNSSMDAFREAQRAFAGEAQQAGLNSEEDVVRMIKELRQESVMK